MCNECNLRNFYRMHDRYALKLWWAFTLFMINILWRTIFLLFIYLFYKKLKLLLLTLQNIRENFFKYGYQDIEEIKSFIFVAMDFFLCFFFLFFEKFMWNTASDFCVFYLIFFLSFFSIVLLSLFFMLKYFNMINC